MYSVSVSTVSRNHLSDLCGLNGFIWQTESVMFYLTGCVLALLEAVDRKMEFISRLVRTGLVN
jgi:hypothetical protein